MQPMPDCKKQPRETTVKNSSKLSKILSDLEHGSKLLVASSKFKRPSHDSLKPRMMRGFFLDPLVTTLLTLTNRAAIKLLLSEGIGPSSRYALSP
jgi:hypothetical protein